MSKSTLNKMCNQTF